MVTKIAPLKPRNIVPTGPMDLIEPPRTGAGAAARHLTYNGGPLIQNVGVYTIFWGDDWSDASADLANSLNQFFSDITQSTLMDQMAEYSVDGRYTIGPGSLIGSVTLPTGDLSSQIADTDIQQRLAQWIDDGTLPQPDQNTLYFLYLPAGVTVSLGADQSCAQFCGYHDATGDSVYYAVMPYPTCGGCDDNGQMSDLDALTATSSHELCEAITDPAPPTGWYDHGNNMEIGDLCAWSFKRIGQWLVQLEWSNAAPNPDGTQGDCI